MEKKGLRKEMIRARLALSPEERAARSLRAQRALLTSSQWELAQTVLLYMPIRGEVETGLLVEAALAQGKRLLLPRVEPGQGQGQRPLEPRREQPARRLWLHRWSGSEKELATGAYGILEPRPELPVVEPDEVDLVVVPGVAFDRHGNRLGYGGGYYDRALPGMTGATKLGLCFSLQVVGSLPAEVHDVRLDGLVTEEGMWPSALDRPTV